MITNQIGVLVLLLKVFEGLSSFPNGLFRYVICKKTLFFEHFTKKTIKAKETEIFRRLKRPKYVAENKIHKKICENGKNL